MRTRQQLDRFRGLMLVALLVAAPAVSHGEESNVPRLPVEEYRLPNGLKVALSHDPAAPRTTVCITYHVGSKNEREGLTGFAHFFEHMMFRGTANVPNFDVPLQEAGASPNAFTSEDVTVYFETVPNHFVQRALYMEAERMGFLHTALDQEKFDTEREVVKNERRQVMENVPYGLAEETIQSYVFPPGHPYSWSVIGSMRDLDRASLEDLRQFFFEFYHPGNATLTLVGSFDPQQTRQWIEQYFGAIQSGQKTEPVVAPAATASAQRITQRDRVQFPRVYWSWPTVHETHADAPALDLLAAILTDGDASRLFRALVVDQRLASTVDAGSDTREIAGTFVISATAAPDATIEPIEAVLHQQLEQLRTTPPTDSELLRAKNKHEVDSLRGLTSPMMRAVAIGTGFAKYDDPHHYQTAFTDYAPVRPEDIQRVAQKYLAPEHFTLLIVPAGPDEEESPAVLAGPAASQEPKPEIAARPAPTGEQWRQLPEPTAPQELATPAIQRAKLANGLEVWISPWRSLPLVSVRLIVPTGTADDGELAGRANLTARVWNQGTQQLDSQEFTILMDTLGVALETGASSDMTELAFTSGTSQLNEVLHHLGPLVVEPRLDPADIQREKDLMLSELARGPDNPAWIAERAFPRLLYGDHPYGSPGLGYATTVGALTRDALSSYYQQRFVPDGAILIVVGDVDPGELITTLEEEWQAWKGHQPVSERDALERAATPDTVYVVDKPGAVQSILRVGRIWQDRTDPGYVPGILGNRVLGGDFLSRINQNLRERHGFTYGARSAFRFRRSGGEWLIGTSVRTDVTGEALRQLLLELDGPLKERPITADEIDVARDAELNELPESFETPTSIASVLAELAIFDLPDDYLTQYPHELRSTKTEDVSQVLSRLLQPEQRVLLVIGDRKEIVPQLEQAGFKNLVFVNSDGLPPTSAAGEASNSD